LVRQQLDSGGVPGLVSAVLVGLVLSRYIVGIHPVDAPVLVAVAGSVLVTGLLASVVPFRGSLHSDPHQQLRGL
jgi:hypothetical protein